MLNIMSLVLPSQKVLLLQVYCPHQKRAQTPNTVVYIKHCQPLRSPYCHFLSVYSPAVIGPESCNNPTFKISHAEITPRFSRLGANIMLL